MLCISENAKHENAKERLLTLNTGTIPLAAAVPRRASPALPTTLLQDRGHRGATSTSARSLSGSTAAGCALAAPSPSVVRQGSCLTQLRDRLGKRNRRQPRNQRHGGVIGPIQHGDPGLQAQADRASSSSACRRLR